MAFSRDHLNQNEEVVLDLHPHWWFLVPRGAVLLLALVFGGWALAGLDDGGVTQAVRIVAAVAVVGALVAFLLQVIAWVSTDFVLTNERCIYRSGVLSKQGVEIPLDRINTVFFNQTIFERMIRAGDIGIESAGENSRQSFSDILNPHAVQSAIYREMEAYEHRRQDRLGSVVRGAGGTAGLSVAEQLEKLHELRSRGAITDEEYEREKGRLLGA
jgi:uncharacterized membrane protein YdbT with pleckstrin-like domain